MALLSSNLKINIHKLCSCINTALIGFYIIFLRHHTYKSITESEIILVIFQDII